MELFLFFLGLSGAGISLVLFVESYNKRESRNLRVIPVFIFIALIMTSVVMSIKG